MKLNLKSTRQGIARNGGSVYVEATLDPGRPRDRHGPRRPVALCLVFDRSGSMGEPAGGCDREPVHGNPQPGRHPYPPIPGPLYGRTKMDAVKAAAAALVDHLREGDYVSLVSFSETARVEVPMTMVNSWSRSRLHQVIASFRPEATTNLYEGLLRGEHEFAPPLLSTHNCKLILLSDGLANVGATSPGAMADFALTAHRRGLTVSALGVGLDYSAELMGALAQCGGGRFHHIADAYRLPEIILQEMETTATVPARQVVLKVGADPMVALGTNLNMFHQEPGPGGVSIFVGDLTGPKSLVFEVATPGGFAGDVLSLNVTCRYENTSGNRREVSGTLPLPVVTREEFEALPFDVDLAAEIADLLESRGTRLATGAYDSGDEARALCSVDNALSALQGMATGAPEVDGRLEESGRRLRLLATRFRRRDYSPREAKEAFLESYTATARPKDEK
jgi:Ca-activated chloride channel family protein